MPETKQLPPAILMDCDIRSIEGVISSFGKRGVEVIALTAQSAPPPAFKSRYVKAKYQSPTVWQEEAYLQFLVDLPHRGVLVYSSDAGAEFVSKNKEAIQEAGFLINVADFELFKRAFNKDEIYKECQASGVPTMATKEVNSIQDIYDAVEEIGFPLLLKPTRLAGGKYLKIKRQEDIAPMYQEMMDLIHSEEYEVQQSDLIIQEFIVHHYTDIYCCESYYPINNKDHDFLSIRKVRPNINYDGTVGSRLHAGITLRLPELERQTKQILDYLNWQGFAHLDWLYSEKHQQFLLCEINPRLPGFSNFVTSIGFDMAWYYYADLVGLQPKKYKFKRALYFEAWRHPGDLTTNLLAVFKGHLSFWSYLWSYLKIFSFRYKVVFDVFYSRDFKLTWENYKISFRNLRRKINV